MDQHNSSCLIDDKPAKPAAVRDTTMSEPSPRRLFPNRERLFAFLLFIVTFLVFSQALRSNFVEWDDAKLYNNPHLTGINWQSIYWMFTDIQYVPRYLPLTWLGVAINYELGGMNPFGYHFGNLLLHSLDAVLVFFLLCKLFRTVIRVNDEPTGPQNNFFLACCALGTLVWAIHPLRTEPVLWVSARLYSQCLFFILIAFLCYLRTFELPDGSAARRRYYWASVIAFACSLLSFQTSLGSIVVLVVLDFYMLRQRGFEKPLWTDKRLRRSLLEKIPFALIVGGIIWVTLLARFNQHGAARSSFAAEGFGTLHRLAQASYIFAYYFWKPFVPFDLSPVYTTLISFNPFEARFIASFVFLSAVTLLLLWKHRKWPLLIAIWVCYLGLLAPMAGITEHPHYSSDRYSYIASLCGTILLVAGVLMLKKPMARKWALIGGTGMALIFGGMSMVQARIWQDSPSLFNHILVVLKDDPYRADIYRRLGAYYSRQDNHAEAAKAYEKCLEVNPQNIFFHQDYAETLFKLNRTNEAKAQFEAAIQMDPKEPDIRNAYAVQLAMKEDFTGALREFEAAAVVDPTYANTFHNIGLLLKKQGKTNEAAPYFTKAEQLRSAKK